MSCIASMYMGFAVLFGRAMIGLQCDVVQDAGEAQRGLPVEDEACRPVGGPMVRVGVLPGYRDADRIRPTPVLCFSKLASAL